jgi:hypothetical protein
MSTTSYLRHAFRYFSTFVIVRVRVAPGSTSLRAYAHTHMCAHLTCKYINTDGELPKVPLPSCPWMDRCLDGSMGR